MPNKLNKIIGLRLRAAREKLCLTLENVASQVGFNNYQTLSNIEEGTRKIEVSELVKLANIYLRDIAYFLNPEESQEKEAIVVWRKKPEGNKRNHREQEFLKYCNNYYDLERRLGLDSKCKLNPLPNITPEAFSFEKIEEIANEYTKLMQLGARPACVLEKILDEKYNVKVLYLDLADSGSAASAIGDFGSAILINSSEPPWRRNYDLAHELFHIITWNIFNYNDVHDNISNEKPLLEKWADAFAANLLLPADDVRNEWNKRIQNGKISIIDIIGLAREFVVSTDALIWRLVIVGILSRKAGNLLTKAEEIRKIDRAERLNDWEKYPPKDISARYLNLAVKTYQKGLISKGKLAEYLDVSIADVSDRLLEYGYNEEAVYGKEITVAGC